MRVVFFGDSICVGQFVPWHRTWVARMTESLESAHGTEFTFLNASVSGNTTRMALERMPHDVQAHGVDVLLVQFGMNDCNYWATDNGLPRVSPKAFEANLTEIVRRGQVFGAERVILCTNHPTCRREIFPGTSITYQESNEHYNGIIREVAIQTGSVLVDHEATWLAGASSRDDLGELLLADGIHLSTCGHDLYFRTVDPVVLSLTSSHVITRTPAS